MENIEGYLPGCKHGTLFPREKMKRKRGKEEPSQERYRGNSVTVQWLGLGAFTTMARVQSLDGEVRSRKPH